MLICLIFLYICQKTNAIVEGKRRSETFQTHVVFSGDLNDCNILFGGTAMQWMDEVAYITGTRFLRQESVTVSVENIKFLLPINQGSIITITGKVTETSNVKIKVQVQIFRDEKYSGKKYKATVAIFWFAAVDENHNPVRLEFVEELVGKNM